MGQNSLSWFFLMSHCCFLGQYFIVFNLLLSVPFRDFPRCSKANRIIYWAKCRLVSYLFLLLKLSANWAQISEHAWYTVRSVARDIVFKYLLSSSGSITECCEFQLNCKGLCTKKIFFHFYLNFDQLTKIIYFT